MSDTLAMALAWLAGGLIGGFFFGALWWTTRAGLSSKRPALWFVGGLVVRMGVALTGFYFVSGGQVGRLLFCLAGFITGRIAVTWLTRSIGQESSPLAQEAGHTS